MLFEATLRSPYSLPPDLERRSFVIIPIRGQAWRAYRLLWMEGSVESDGARAKREKGLAAGGVYALGVGRLIEAIAAARKKMFTACGLGESQRKASWMSSIAISRAMLAICAGSCCGLTRRNSVVQ